MSFPFLLFFLSEYVPGISYSSITWILIKMQTLVPYPMPTESNSPFNKIPRGIFMPELLQNGYCCLKRTSKTYNTICKLKFASESITSSFVTYMFPVLLPECFPLQLQQLASVIGCSHSSVQIRPQEASCSKGSETQDYTISICFVSVNT